MNQLVTPSGMYALEARHFAAGLPTIEAMENAASAFVSALTAHFGSLTSKRIAVACGSGNNGGDGYAIARLSAQAGAEAVLLAASPLASLRGDALINAKRAIEELHLPIYAAGELDSVARPDIWVDALFGIGLNRPVSADYAPLISRIAADRAAGSLVASVDIPSGLNAESGRIEGVAVRADLTVTFQYAKTGHYLLDGMDCTGKLVVCDIGMNQFAPDEPVFLADAAYAASAFPMRLHNSHKGTYGHLLIIAGSFGMTGAAAYTAHAALRAGAGLVTIACPRSIVPILQTILPAAMCIPLSEEDGAVSAEAYPVIKHALSGKSAAVIGPGLSMRAHPDAIRAVLESGLPAVIDADALNLIAAHDNLRPLLTTRHIITPHPGEARRLCPSLTGNPLDDAGRLSETGAIVLLKGPATVVRGECVSISASGSPGMATGGSGDVLSGIIGALLAAGIAPERAALCGSEVHGLCGESAEDTVGPVSMTASDLIDRLPSVVRSLASV